MGEPQAGFNLIVYGLLFIPWHRYDILLVGSLLLLALRIGYTAVRRPAGFRREDVILEDKLAVFLGWGSKGPCQVRGNGVLRLSSQALQFVQYLPSREWVIEFDKIVHVGFVGSHLGRGHGAPLLRVSCERAGEPDLVAWYVRDMERWMEAIQEACGKLASGEPRDAS